jgi:RNA polymerase sigma-70 factor (ECF subfamily)
MNEPHSSGLCPDGLRMSTIEQLPSEQGTLREAIAAIRGGDQEAYAQIIRLYQKRLFSLALMIVRDRAGAEDVVQEAFIRAYAHLHRYEEIRDFYPWIATIAVRIAQNWRRSRARLQTQDDDAPHAELAAPQDVLGEILVDERAAQLWQLVSRLPRGERTAVLLFYQQDMKVTDVARVLGVTPGSIKTLLFRAREKLRKDLGTRDSKHALHER